MKNKCTAVFLSFVTKGNSSLREDLFFKCFPTFEKLRDENAAISLQLVAVDNMSIESVRDRIMSSSSIDVLYLLDQNMFDTALFCAGLDAASHSGSDYVLFTYDDFLVYRPEALLDVIEFMNNSNADCCRITDYDVKDSYRFNSDFTPKTLNPDAIKHSNVATGQKIVHNFFGKFGNSDFYLTNWHYTSRPSVWRVSKLKEVMSKFSDYKILQGFEGQMIKACQDSGVVFSTLDKGMMKTFPVNLSARTSPDFSKRVDEVNHTVSLESMNQVLASCKILREKL